MEKLFGAAIFAGALIACGDLARPDVPSASPECDANHIGNHDPGDNATRPAED